MAVSNKKVVVRTIAGAIHFGYLPAASVLSASGDIDLLALDGRILSLPLGKVRSIAYVRDFNLTDTRDPERLSRRTFLSRPRNEGLWIRIVLAHDELIEGLAAPDLSLFDTLLKDRGLLLTPPDVRSNTQRLFIPHHTITSLQILAVITTPSRPAPPPEAPQPTLFS